MEIKFYLSIGRTLDYWGLFSREIEGLQKNILGVKYDFVFINISTFHFSSSKIISLLFSFSKVFIATFSPCF